MYLAKPFLLLCLACYVGTSVARELAQKPKRESGPSLSSTSAPAASYVPYWPYDRCKNNASTGTVTDNAKQRIVDGFNNMVATHQIGVRYQFNRSQHFIVEGAQRLVAAGATTFKFSLTRNEAPGVNASTYASYVNASSFIDFVTDPKLPWLEVFDLPFSTFQFWYLQKWIDPKNPTKPLDPYQQTYEVATYLLKRYNNSGKTFMFGEWKLDTQLWWPPPSAGIAKPKFPYLSQPFNPNLLQELTDRVSSQQKAVDDAKRDLGNKIQNVFVWYYIEVNKLPDPDHPTFLTHGLPKVKLPVDYISFSLSTSPELCDSLPLMADRMATVLSTANSFVPPKPTVPGVRTFIGEFEYPLLEENGTASVPTVTEALQAQYALWQAASLIAWGSPYNMWWTLYDNTITFNTTNPKVRGFHLVTPENRETLLFKALQEYWQAGRAYVAGWVDAKGKAPGDFAFRKWAVGKLAALSNVTDLPKPSVKDQGC